MPSIQRYTPDGGSAYVFSDTGRPHYSEKATFETEKHGLPRRKIVRHGLVQWFREPSFADNQARYAALRTALLRGEGVLYIEDEGGNERVNQRVRVLAHDLPEQWGQFMAEVRIEFESVQEITGPAQAGAAFTPDAGDPVSLGDVREWTSRIDTERFSTLVPNRRESRLGVSARGSIRANPSDTPAARLATLQAAEAAIRGLDKVDGTLTYGAAFSERVRVSECIAALGDGSDELTWSLTAEMLTFPSGDYCEANWKVSQRDDTQASERLTTVAGTIRAHDEAAALAKRDAILGTFTADTRLYKGGSWEASLLDGADGATDVRSWDFSLGFREPLPDASASYTLKVATKIDETTGLITTTYSGRVTAATTAAALTQARTLGQNKLDMKLSEDEEVETISLAGSTAQHTQVTFAYAYESRGSETHAEVTSNVSRDTFGACVQTVGGYAVAATSGAALTLARTFKAGGVLVQGESEGDAEDYHQAAQLFKRITFTYTYRLAAAIGSLDYTVGTADNFDTRETVTTYRGTVRAADAGTADGLIGTLVAGLTGRWVANERESHFLSGNTSVFDCRTFTIAKAAALSNSETILDAQVTITTTASFSKAVITEIPYGTPYVQSDVGLTVGTVVATGSVKAVGLSTAKTWARAWVPAGGYQTAPASEAVTANYLPRSGTAVGSYTVAFTYPISYPNLSFT